LGVRDDHQPGPAIGCARIPQFRDGPTQGLLEQPERVLDVEATQECLPAAVDIRRCGVHVGPPQPDRFRVTTAGQVTDLQPDDGAGDDR
jgi:hypothetical protein